MRRIIANKGIAVVGPSGAPLDEDGVIRGLSVLEQQGFLVHNYYQPQQKIQRFAATDQERLMQIHTAATNPNVQVVMALRGSYGLSRLMPSLDMELLANSGKYFVGYSDFTLMHMRLLARGQISIAGPMLCDDYTRDNLCDYTLNQFADCLNSTRHTVDFHSHGATDMAVQGTLWGGNLAMLVHMLGTPYWTQIDDGILFIEDIGEHPYRVERMLLQLQFAGVLKTQKAILLGDFSGYRLAAHDNGYDFDAMLAYVRSVIDVPVLTGLPFGHIRERATLVVGSQASLLVSANEARLTMGYAL